MPLLVSASSAKTGGKGRGASQQAGPPLHFLPSVSCLFLPSSFPVLFNITTPTIISLFLNPWLLAAAPSIPPRSLDLGLVDQRQVWILWMMDRETVRLCGRNLFLLLGFQISD